MIICCQGNQIFFKDTVFTSPLVFTEDFVVYRILIILWFIVFYTSCHENSFWKKFHIIFPSKSSSLIETFSQTNSSIV